MTHRVSAHTRVHDEPSYGDARWRQWAAKRMIDALLVDSEHIEELEKLEHHIVCLLAAVRAWKSEPLPILWKDLSDQEGSGAWKDGSPSED